MNNTKTLKLNKLNEILSDRFIKPQVLDDKYLVKETFFDRQQICDHIVSFLSNEIYDDNTEIRYESVPKHNSILIKYKKYSFLRIEYKYSKVEYGRKMAIVSFNVSWDYDHERNKYATLLDLMQEEDHQLEWEEKNEIDKFLRQIMEMEKHIELHDFFGALEIYESLDKKGKEKIKEIITRNLAKC